MVSVPGDQRPGDRRQRQRRGLPVEPPGRHAGSPGDPPLLPAPPREHSPNGEAGQRRLPGGASSGRPCRHPHTCSTGLAGRVGERSSGRRSDRGRWDRCRTYWRHDSASRPVSRRGSRGDARGPLGAAAADAVPKPDPGGGLGPRGTELCSYLQELVGYWMDGFDWRAQESRINGLEQFMTTIVDQPIHYIPVRSPEGGGASPLVLSHGWPGSVVDSSTPSGR